MVSDLLGSNLARRRASKAGKRDGKHLDDDGPRRISLACAHCRSRKTKCDGGNPCANCMADGGRVCTYIKVTAEENALARAKKQTSRLAKAAKVKGESPIRRAGSSPSLQSRMGAVSMSRSSSGLSSSPSPELSYHHTPQHACHHLDLHSAHMHVPRRRVATSAPLCHCVSAGGNGKQGHHCHSPIVLQEPAYWSTVPPAHEHWDLPTPPDEVPSPTYATDQVWSQAPSSSPRVALMTAPVRPPFYHTHSMPSIMTQSRPAPHVHHSAAPPLASPLARAYAPHYHQPTYVACTSTPDYPSPYTTSDYGTQYALAGDYFEGTQYVAEGADYFAQPLHDAESTGCISPQQLLSPAASLTHSRSVSTYSGFEQEAVDQSQVYFDFQPEMPYAEYTYA